MKKIINFLDNYLEEVLLVAALVAMAVIMGIQVFCRYVLSASLSWSEELTRYIFIWVGFLSISYCTKKCISIKIEQFLSLFPRHGKALFKIVNHTFELILFLYLLPFAWKYLISAIENGQTSPAMGIPMYLVQAAPLVGFLLTAIRVFQRWIVEFRAFRGKEEV
ncbi:MAG: TRAP transporter small permease [Candidatus Ruminococcus intestinipullorum]|nr:TRAP transporter small permease [Candidatus Ruminococcus intestinipullorum]